MLDVQVQVQDKVRSGGRGEGGARDVCLSVWQQERGRAVAAALPDACDLQILAALAPAIAAVTLVTCRAYDGWPGRAAWSSKCSLVMGREGPLGREEGENADGGCDWQATGG